MTSNCAETCVFCGKEAYVDSNIPFLTKAIADVLRFRSMQTQQISELKGILERLSDKQITLEQAAEDIESVTPGLGRTICDQIRKHGLVLVPLLIAGYGLLLQQQAVDVAREANEISRQALEFAIEQATDKATSEQKLPSDKKVRKAAPHRPVKENRHIRRAKKAKERKGK